MTMTSIYQLIQNDPDPKHWQEFIDAHENLRADDPDIINQVLHSSTHHIQTILDSENYIALGQYIAYLKHHFLTSYRYQLQLNKTIPELIHEHLLGIHSPEKKADIIELLKDNEALSFQTYSKLIAEQRQAITKIVKKELDLFNFKVATNYNNLPNLLEPRYKDKLKNQIRLAIYQGDISEEALNNALKYGFITTSEVGTEKLKKVQDEKRATLNKFLNAVDENPNFCTKIHAAFIKNDLNDAVFDVQIDKNPPCSINEALNSGQLDEEALDKIKTKADETYQALIEERERQKREEQERREEERLAVIKAEQEAKREAELERQRQQEWARRYAEAEARREEVRRQKLAEYDRENARLGMERKDWIIMKQNDLIQVMKDEDDMNFCFCLALYTKGSEMTDEGQFETTYTKLGQIIHDLKYNQDLTDDEKLELINHKLLPIILDKTDDLSLWQRRIIVVPMPFTKHRSLQPVYAIAEAVAKAKHLPYAEDILHKNSLVEAKRNTNDFDQDDFSVSYNGNDTSILIIDDTFGTGKTLKASVTALKQNPHIHNVYYMGIAKNRSGGLINI